MKKALSLLTIVAMAALGVVATPDEGAAVPSFARQTGNPCFACHFQHIPKLNSFGRAFKLGGYTDASVDLIEDDNLSIPAVMPVSVVVKLRYQVADQREDSQPDKRGKERGEFQIPDEAAIWIGGRIAENWGYAVEWPGGWASGKVVYSAPVGGGNAGVSIYSTDALGPFFGMELFNTGVLRSIRMLEHRREYSPAQNIGIGTGAAQGISLFFGNEMMFASVGLWGPAFEHVDTGLDLSTLYRLAITPTIGDDWDTMIGIFGTAGKTKCVDCAEIGPNAAGTEQEFKTESFGVDVQAQGELSNGMTLEAQAMYTNVSADDVIYDKSDAFGIAFDLGVNRVWNLIAAYQSDTRKGGPSDLTTNATTLGVVANMAQNLRLGIDHTFFADDGRVYDNLTTLMLMGGF